MTETTMMDFTALKPFDYDHCRICGATVPPALAALAARRVENATCGSVACNRKEIIAHFGCCDKAELVNCVCAYAFKCPVHGAKHVGTHD